ncbi:hypothetical protein, partial [Microcystis aeruginosa]|uniref:hypothetical protein n=1 Tax=Microcystis aeruginosa TaxID=1126 RepID=UPI0004696513
FREMVLLKLKPDSLVLISGKVSRFFPTPYPHTLFHFQSACHPLRLFFFYMLLDFPRVVIDRRENAKLGKDSTAKSP